METFYQQLKPWIKGLHFIGMVIETKPGNQPLFKIELQLESGCCPFLDKSKFSKYIILHNLYF